jgi:hypothetical protein
MCEREQKINKDEGGTPPFLHKTSTKNGRAFLKILEDKNKKKHLFSSFFFSLLI